MRIITEIELRDLYKKKPFDTYHLKSLEKLTPAARQFLTERRINITGDPVSCGERQGGFKSTPPVKEPAAGFLIQDTGKVVPEKPEEYTHIRGRILVLKNHRRIKFRGKVDSLEANLINTIVECKALGDRNMANDLTYIFEYVKKIMRAEVLEENLPPIEFNGWSGKEIREYSHEPEKYFGIKHITPDPKYGKIMAMLNLLRTSIRELEISAVDAFYDDRTGSVGRQDIIIALNRLSSLVYVIMCRCSEGSCKV